MKDTGDRRINDAVWDMTVGAGESRGFSQQDVTRLQERLGRPLTEYEVNVARRAWARCLQEMEQP